MRFVRKAKKAGAQIDLIPMIDIVFQLILFFLVSTTFAMLPGITLQLPSSGTAESATTAGITITMEADGTLWFNQNKVDLAGLGEKLAAFDEVEAEERAEYPVQLEADELVTNGKIVKVFDVLRQNGFSAVNLRTSSER